MWTFFVYSLVGTFVFFVPITLNGDSSIVLDHIVNAVESWVPSVLPYFALAVILAGAVHPIVSGTWRRSSVSVAFSAFKVIGLVVGIMLVFDVGPAWLFEANMGPFLLNKLVIPVGLLEFVGSLVQPVMLPVWKTPGRSAIDAVASFVGSYSHPQPDES